MCTYLSAFKAKVDMLRASQSYQSDARTLRAISTKRWLYRVREMNRFIPTSVPHTRRCTSNMKGRALARDATTRS